MPKGKGKKRGPSQSQKKKNGFPNNNSIQVELPSYGLTHDDKLYQQNDFFEYGRLQHKRTQLKNTISILRSNAGQNTLDLERLRLAEEELHELEERLKSKPFSDFTENNTSLLDILKQIHDE